jgi:UDP-N-acetylmuramoyl-tripeptide--D-alanyl-D-alanine ligase
MMSLSEAASVLSARATEGEVVFTRVSTDTRTLKTGDIFVALRGERFDGHGFLDAARAAGAAAAMIDSAADAGSSPLPALVVDDTRLALGRLAAHWRSRFSLPLVALTGSSGKTTVKEMLAAILREAAAAVPGKGAAEESVLATRGNLNNDIGMPLTLLELRPSHRYAVIEMGMNHAGEIRYLSELAAPEIALITNAGSAHIEFLGSEEAIARAKGEILEGLDASGTAVINADERFAPMWRDLAGKRRRIEFGLEAAAQVTATYNARALENDIVLKTPTGTATATLRAPGEHNVRNALAAAAGAIALEIPVDTVAAGLARYSGVKGRLQVKRAAKGARLIDDTYNANPESVRAAIDVLAQSRGRKVFVFGDMGELGARAPQLHSEIGAYARTAGIDRVLALGEQASATAAAFGTGASHYTRLEDLLAELRKALHGGVTVLVKGSRFMKMERVVAAVAADDAEEAREKGGEKKQ